MERKKLTLLLRSIIIMVFVFAVAFYSLFIPELVSGLAEKGYAPSVISTVNIGISASCIPVLFALINVWGIVTDFSNDKSASIKNSKRLFNISILSFIDTGYCLVFTVWMIWSKIHFATIYLISGLIMILGITISITAALLSHLVEKVSVLQEDVDLTI